MFGDIIKKHALNGYFILHGNLNRIPSDMYRSYATIIEKQMGEREKHRLTILLC